MHILIGPNRYNLDQVIPALTAQFPKLTFDVCEDDACVSDRIAEADAYCGWLNRDQFLAAKNLRWIQSPSTGVDAFCRIPELVEGDVILTNARGAHAVPLAEQALAGIFAFTRGTKVFLEHQARHEWASRERREELVELTGSTLGIVGFGTVGQAIAERAQAFGMRILAVDLLQIDKPDYVERLDGADGLDALLQESDYVVITVPYTELTHGMIGAAELARMKPSAILVGVSRGGIIDEAALVDALTSGQLAAAALDVFETEPLSEDSELWDIDNLVITPHAAGGSQFEAPAIRAIFKENVERYLEDDFPLRNTVDKQRGF
ncbi:MAG: D-2-hydroxyacid dehydrogenase [Anaerolineae bacterium]